MRSYICPVRMCYTLSPGLWGLFDHLRDTHGMAGWSANVSTQTLRWDKTGDEYPMVWMEEDDLPLRPIDTRSLNESLAALDRMSNEQELARVWREVESLGIKMEVTP